MTAFVDTVCAIVLPAVSCKAPAAIAIVTAVPAAALLPAVCVASIVQVLPARGETEVLKLRLGALE